MVYEEIKVATSAWIGSCYIRATDSFHKQEVYDFVRVGEGENAFYGQLWLLFQYQDVTGTKHNLTWIQHLGKEGRDFSTLMLEILVCDLPLNL
jgi:hypothetical protein